MYLCSMFQYFVVVKGIQPSIKADIKKEAKPLWELGDMGLENCKPFLLQHRRCLFLFLLQQCIPDDLSNVS